MAGLPWPWLARTRRPRSPKATMELLTYSDLETYTKLKRGTLHWLVSTRQIPHLRLGPRTVRFDRAEIDRWLAERATGVAGKECGP